MVKKTVTLAEIEALVKEAKPDYSDAQIAAVVLYFIKTTPPARYLTNDGVMVDNVAKLSTQELMDDDERRQIESLKERAQGLVYDPSTD